MEPLEVWPLFLPESVEYLKLLIGHRPSVLEWHAQRVKLFYHPADPHAPAQSSFGAGVNGRGDSGCVKRVAIGQGADGDAELDRSGASGPEGQATGWLQGRTIR